MGEPVVSFPEYTCWSDENFRAVRKPVVFQVRSLNDELGCVFDVEMVADYGIWYHQHDEILIEMLREVCPAIDWGPLVYIRRWDHSGIDIYEPEGEDPVARMEVRQYRGARLDELERDFGGNVVRLADWRTSRLSAEPVDELLLTEIWDGE